AEFVWPGRGGPSVFTPGVLVPRSPARVNSAPPPPVPRRVGGWDHALRPPRGRVRNVLVGREVERLSFTVDVETVARVGELDGHRRPTHRASGAADLCERRVMPHEVDDVVGLIVEDAVRELHLHGWSPSPNPVAHLPRGP